MLPHMDLTPAFIFDLDGTLVDTAPDLLATLNTILAREGRQGVASTELRRLVGRGARNLLNEAFKLTGSPLDPARLEGLYEFFLADYTSHIADASRPFPGVIETLERLKTEGARMAVLTNKPHGPSVSLIRALGMEAYFAAVWGQGKRAWLKPDKRLFAELMAELGGGGAVMIGDSITDVETARAAGVPVVLVSYGYTPEPAAALGADLVVDDFSEVPEAVAKLLGR